MRIVVNIITIIILIISLAFMVYGFAYSKHTVYDKPVEGKAIDPASSATMSEPQLLEEMNYDAIITDVKGNLINKRREAACST
ncbi:MAG: hypothetical protein HY811_04955 [Planctomycetes bacterium]|nr:hypothetical protein [Planctomycetota bacterium]